MDYGTDTLLNDKFLIFIAAMVIGGFIIVAFFINFLLQFKEERDYIKMEMNRSYKEKEYLYWRRKLKHLYLRSIPLIGKFFK